MQPRLRGTPAALSILLAASSGITALASADVATGDAEAGRKAFNRSCRACHQVEPGAGSELGPNLAGVFGRAAPVDAAYGYSDAFKAAAARGLVWDDATLDRFLRTPAEMIPGVRMPLSVADATQRRDLVAYLATLAP
jgi:cytochrome c2